MSGKSIDHPLYNTYRNMIKRCSYPFKNDYKHYGGRGIDVCARWRGRGGFVSFLEDMGDKPDSSYTLDRIDVNGNYEPRNCRWASISEQRNNMRSNRLITYKDKTLNLAGWARLTGVGAKTIHYRLKAGWSLQEALETKRYGRKNVSNSQSQRITRREEGGRSI